MLTCLEKWDLLLLYRGDAKQQVKGKFGNKKPGIPCGKSYISWRKKCSESNTKAAKASLKNDPARRQQYANRVRRFKDLPKLGKGEAGSKGGISAPKVESQILDRLNGDSGNHVAFVKDGLKESRQFLREIEAFDLDEIGKIEKKMEALHRDQGLMRSGIAEYSKTKEYQELSDRISANFKARNSLNKDAEKEYNLMGKSSFGSSEWTEHRGKWLKIEAERKKLKKKIDSDTKKQKASADSAIREYIDNLPQAEALRDDLRKAVEPAERFKQKLISSSRLSDKQVGSIVSSLKLPSARVDSNVRNEARDFAKMTEGGAKTLKEIKVSKRRAHAVKETGVATYGGKGNAATLWHEMAHHLEFSNESVAEAAADWRDSRAKTSRPQKLKRITGNKRYANDEIALADDFITPYVGKVYGGKSGIDVAASGKKAREVTEVVSVGLEHFARPDLLTKLAKKDPEHLAFIVGILKNQ